MPLLRVEAALRWCIWHVAVFKHRHCVRNNHLSKRARPPRFTDSSARMRDTVATAAASVNAARLQMSTFGWVLAAAWAGVDIDGFPNLMRWAERVGARPAVKEGLDVPEPNQMMEMVNDPEKMQAAIKDAQKMMVSTK